MHSIRLQFNRHHIFRIRFYCLLAIRLYSISLVSLSWSLGNGRTSYTPFVWEPVEPKPCRKFNYHFFSLHMNAIAIRRCNTCDSPSALHTLWPRPANPSGVSQQQQQKWRIHVCENKYENANRLKRKVKRKLAVPIRSMRCSTLCNRRRRRRQCALWISCVAANSRLFWVSLSDRTFVSLKSKWAAPHQGPSGRLMRSTRVQQCFFFFSYIVCFVFVSLVHMPGWM